MCRKWGFEKLVFRNVRKREHNDCKYAIQARKALATGIHRSGHLIGANTTVYADPLKYYHYHNTINRREELCQEFVHPKNKSKVYINPWNGDPFVYDNGMAILGDQIKKFEQDSVVAPQQFILWMEGEEKNTTNIKMIWIPIGFENRPTATTTTWSCQLLMIYDAAEVIVLVCWEQIKRKFP